MQPAKVGDKPPWNRLACRIARPRGCFPTISTSEMLGQRSKRGIHLHIARRTRSDRIHASRGADAVVPQNTGIVVEHLGDGKPPNTAKGLAARQHLSRSDGRVTDAAERAEIAHAGIVPLSQRPQEIGTVCQRRRAVAAASTSRTATAATIGYSPRRA